MDGLAGNGVTERSPTGYRCRPPKCLTWPRSSESQSYRFPRGSKRSQRFGVEGAVQGTINCHVIAIKAFSQWLHRDGRAREHYLAHYEDVQRGIGPVPRAASMTPDEAGQVILAAEQGAEAGGLSGPDRAMLYALALGTGFRAERAADPDA